MRVQESSITRSEERDQYFRSKVTQYEGKMQKYEKKEKEASQDRLELA
jgi:hypothetical protein